MKVSSFLCLLSLGGVSANAAEIDLARVTPVPADQAIPIQDFFRPFLIRLPKLNPAGTHVAANVCNREGNFQMSFSRLGSSDGIVLENEGDKDVDQFDWLDDRRIAYFLSYGKWHRLALMGLDIQRPTASYPLIQRCNVELEVIPKDDGLHPLIWLKNTLRADTTDVGDGHRFQFKSEEAGLAVLKFAPEATVGVLEPARQVNSLKELNDMLSNNEAHIGKQYPKPPKGEVNRYLGDLSGNPAWAETYEDGKSLVFRWKNDTWQQVPTPPMFHSLVGLGSSSQELVVQEAVVLDGDRHTMRLRIWNPDTKDYGAVLWDDPEYAFIGGLLHDRWTGRLKGIFADRERQVVIWLDPFFKDLQAKLSAKYPGLSVDIDSVDQNRSVVLFDVSSERLAPQYYLYRTASGETTLYRKAAPWLDPNRLRPTKSFHFQSRDGRDLEALLTLPAKASKTAPVPLVVLPHGGPSARDVIEFDPLVQFLVSRGYGVLQPNYRGSLGMDGRFPVDELRDFGKMSDDVTDAVHCVLGTGIVDTDRVAIMGWSFGGFLATRGVETETSLYRCAVSLAGVYDWKEIDEKSQKWSLLADAGKIRVPVFVGHGNDDTVVDVGQSKAFLKALEAAGVKHEERFVPGEGHGTRHLAATIDLYSRIEAFLAKNLAPRPKSTASLH